MDAQSTHTNTWRQHPDDELRHYRQLYRRMRANLRDDIEDPALRESTGQFLDHLLGEIAREIDWRVRAQARGVPIEGSRFSDAFKDDLKARVHLDAMIEYECGISLGRPNRVGERRGPCPFCGGGERSDKFVVHTADDASEWFFCHACRKAGDAFRFLELHYGHPFPVAVEVLAAVCGVPLPDQPRPQGQDRFLKIARGADA